MKSEYYGLIEMSYVFGLALALAGWELYSLRREKKKDALKDAARRAARAEAEPVIPTTDKSGASDG